MKHILLTAMAGACALAFAGAASAQSWSDPGRFSVGLGIGTNGLVGEAAYEIDPHFILRGQGAFLDFNHQFASTDMTYGGKAHFNTGGLSLDWHPYANAFLFTGGVIAGDRKVDAVGRPTGGVVIGGVPYTPAQIGSVNGTIDFGGVAPVAGIGFDNTYVGAHHWGVRALLDVEFGRHPPTGNLQAVGPLATDTAVVAGLQQEDRTLGHDADAFSFYPVGQIGLTYRF